jgi:proline racemase
MNLDWRPPGRWMRISTIEMHTGGEPLRVITGGLPPLEGATVLEKRRYFKDHHDHLRTGLILEPRGHADMYGAVVTPSADADFDVFFLHNEGYSTMCGHAIIALTKLVLESEGAGKEGHTRKLTFNVPAGRVHAQATWRDGKVQDIRFRNVPSFALLENQTVVVEGLGAVRFDVAYGGAFYAIVDARQLNLQLSLDHYAGLIDAGRRIKHAVMANHAISHPVEPELGFLYGTIFTGPAASLQHHSRNVCVFADGEVDRSPTGSGISARAALHHARDELPLGQPIIIESILGSTMTVEVVECARVGPYAAVVPEVAGTAFITGRSEYYFDPEDPLRGGFTVR